MPNYSHHRPLAVTVMRPRAGAPRTSASRKAGCEAHKSGFVRGAPGKLGVPTRQDRRRAAPQGRAPASWGSISRKRGFGPSVGFVGGNGSVSSSCCCMVTPRRAARVRARDQVRHSDSRRYDSSERNLAREQAVQVSFQALFGCVHSAARPVDLFESDFPFADLRVASFLR